MLIQLIRISLFIATLSQAVHAQLLLNDGPDLLKVEEAFPAVISGSEQSLKASFSIAPEYYLYKHAFGFEADNGVQLGKINILLAQSSQMIILVK